MGLDVLEDPYQGQSANVFDSSTQTSEPRAIFSQKTHLLNLEKPLCPPGHYNIFFLSERKNKNNYF